MYLVSKEVYAKNIGDALHRKGKIYSVQLADDKLQPEEQSEEQDKVGFRNKKAEIKN